MKRNYIQLDDKNENSQHLRNLLSVFHELEIHRVIELQAYLLAEKDDFKKSPLDYWLVAEKDVHQYF
jgi:hypothetical protein